MEGRICLIRTVLATYSHTIHHFHLPAYLAAAHRLRYNGYA